MAECAGFWAMVARRSVAVRRAGAGTPARAGARAGGPASSPEAGPARAAAQRRPGELGARQITPTFGRWGYFVGRQLFACFPCASGLRPLIRLPLDQQARALAEGVRPHRRFGARSWVELDVRSPRDLTCALRWLRRAHVAVEGGSADALPED
jgi:hypothetical protein